MYEKVLVPLDGSALSEAALPVAQQLAASVGSDITLTYVSQSADDPHQHMHQLYLQRLAETTRSAIEARLEKKQPKAIIQTAVLSGNAAEVIVDYAERTNIGLIIMTTHGYSGVKRWALGSVAQKVVRATARPMLLIRSRNTTNGVRATGPMKRILLPLDGSTEAEAVVPYTEEMAARLNMEVILLQVLAARYFSPRTYDYVRYSEEHMETFRANAMEYLNKVEDRFFKQRSVATRIEVKSGNAAEEIIRFAGDVSADLVTMSTHGRSGVTRWILGSVAEKVLHEGDTPLLLVRSPEAKLEW